MAQDGLTGNTFDFAKVDALGDAALYQNLSQSDVVLSGIDITHKEGGVAFGFGYFIGSGRVHKITDAITVGLDSSMNGYIVARINLAVENDHSGDPWTSDYKFTLNQSEIVFVNELADEDIVFGRVSNGEFLKSSTFFSGKQYPVISARSFGMTGFETQEVTSLFQQAIDVSSEVGSILYFPNGVYRVDNQLILADNLHIVASSSAIFTKEYAKKGASFLSKTGAGYGAGGKNIIFDGGTWIGGNDEGGPVREQRFSLHHIDGAVFKNMTFKNAQISGHIFDVMGSINIKFENNTFVGIQPSDDRYYAEAIQIDNSTYVGSTGEYGNEPTVYDALPTGNVLVIGNKAVPSRYTDGTIKDFAPNLVGAHGQVKDNIYFNISIKNNYIEDAHPLPNADSPLTGGAVHMRNVIGLNVVGNTFKNTQQTLFGSVQIHVVIGDYTSDPADAGNTNPPVVREAFEDVKDITIADNDFIGITADSSSENKAPVIRVSGYSRTQKYIHNVNITGNQARNLVTDGRMGGNSTTDPTFIYVNYVRNMNISGNTLYNGYAFNDVYNVIGGTISGNTASYLQNHIGVIDDSRGVVIAGNSFGNMYGSLAIDRAKNVTVSGNTIFGFNRSNPVLFNSVVSINGASWQLSGNTIQSDDAGLGNALYVGTYDGQVGNITGNMYSKANTFPSGVNAYGNTVI